MLGSVEPSLSIQVENTADLSLCGRFLRKNCPEADSIRGPSETAWGVVAKEGVPLGRFTVSELGSLTFSGKHHSVKWEVGPGARGTIRNSFWAKD